MLNKITPNEIYEGLPCSVVAVGTALGITDKKELNIIMSDANYRNDGYMTLNDMNRFIRSKLRIQKREYFKKNERNVLFGFLHGDTFEGNQRKAIICVLGHYIYVDKLDYYSFFNNEYDKVVCVWWIKENH